jgi:beta-phosphoglucomutase family hydrolase
MPAAVIFDMDGVLVTTDELHFRSWRLLADRYGWPFAWEVFDRQMRGLERPDAARVFLQTAGQEASEARTIHLAAEKQALFLELLEQSPPAAAVGARELLEELERRGAPLAVGSSSRNAMLVLERLGLALHFQAIVGAGELPGKPSPAIFLEAARRLNVEPTSCVVLEDAIDGVRAAAAAQMKVVAIGPAARFAGLPVNWRVDRLADVTADALLGLA